MIQQLIISSLQFLISVYVKKNDAEKKNLCLIKKLMMLEIVNKNNLVLICGYKGHILCFVQSVQFVNFVFSTIIWFVKASNRIVKYESRIIKSNPDYSSSFSLGLGDEFQSFFHLLSTLVFSYSNMSIYGLIIV